MFTAIFRRADNLLLVVGKLFGRLLLTAALTAMMIAVVLFLIGSSLIARPLYRIGSLRNRRLAAATELASAAMAALQTFGHDDRPDT